MRRRREETTVAHLPLIDSPRGLLRRYAWRYSRKVFGHVVEPVQAQAHHTGVLLASGALEMAVERRWKALDEHLRWLALQATSAAIGCSWCIDYGFYESVQAGVDPRKVRDVQRWRDSDVYDERERLVLEYAEVLNATPAGVSAELVDRLRTHLSDEQLVELTGWIALENYRSRFNAGLGLTSEGFSDRCEIPATAPS
ncbi:MAG TPA: carboxymuconolactone decarboxylase family protein [Mycobacteriales bacterium]|nr:carboxymuconolactone decarboxylase family protein [Mycobacteriales bacterium]